MTQRHLGASRCLRKIVLVDVSLMTRFPQIFHKRHILFLSRRERHFMVRGCFCKTEARSRIPLAVSKSVCKTKQKLEA